MMGNNAALVAHQELAAHNAQSLWDALRYSMSYLVKGLILDAQRVRVRERRLPAGNDGQGLSGLGHRGRGGVRIRGRLYQHRDVFARTATHAPAAWTAVRRVRSAPGAFNRHAVQGPGHGRAAKSQRAPGSGGSPRDLVEAITMNKAPDDFSPGAPQFSPEKPQPFLYVIVVVVGSPPPRPGLVDSTTRFPEPSIESAMVLVRSFPLKFDLVVITSLLPSHLAVDFDRPSFRRTTSCWCFQSRRDS